MTANENRPTSDDGAASNHATDRYATPRTADVLAAARGHCLIVSSSEGKYRRRLFLSLHAAEKAKERAQARGCYAAIVLAVIVPTGVAE